MKRKTIITGSCGKAWMLALVWLLVGMVSACNDKGDDPAPSQEDEQLEERNDQLSYKLLLRQLCEVEQQSDGSEVYTPLRGVALKSATPTVYYIAVESLAEAEAHYYDIISVLNEDVNGSLTDYEVKAGDCRLKFVPSTGTGEMAYIEVDCPALQDCLTELVFISTSQWPANDINSPYNILSVWHNKSSNRYYLCVRSSDAGAGIMLTFDSGWSSVTRQKRENNQTYSLFTNTATSEALGLISYLMQYRPNKFKNLLTAMERHPEAKSSNTYKYLQRLYNGESLTFDYNYSIEEKGWWLWSYDLVKISKISLNTEGSNRVAVKWTATYGKNAMPASSTGSSSFNFLPGKVDTTYWEAIFR